MREVIPGRKRWSQPQRLAGIAIMAVAFWFFTDDDPVLVARRARGEKPRSAWLELEALKNVQVWRFALPGLGNLWVNLVKDTALVSIIALNDLMRMTQVAVGFTKKPFTFYLAACLAYWAVCALSEVGSAKLEARANRGIRRA